MLKALIIQGLYNLSDDQLDECMNGSIVRTIGLTRAKAKIGLMNLTYNIGRFVQLKTVVSMG
jgi:hypothetical protein